MVDVFLVKVWKVDKEGNLIYCKIVWNFNLMMVIVGKIIVVEVEELVEVGELDVDNIYIVGIFVDCIIVGSYEKCIEKCIMCEV